MFGPFIKQKPFQGMSGFGGGATGLANAGGISPVIDATGGTKTTPGDGYVYHYMTGGTFSVASQGVGPDGIIDICLVGGGGGGGQDRGGGGGAGGFRITTVDIATLGAGSYPVSVGGGGPGGPGSGPYGNRNRASNGSPSYFTLTPTTKVEVGGGGGGGGQYSKDATPTLPSNHGADGSPTPHPTASTPHPNTTVYPGSGGGSTQGQTNGGGDGAGPTFNSSPGQRGFGNEDAGISRGGGGGGAGSTYSPTSTGGDGGVGKQLPWALPTWGWGQNDDSNTPGGYGWFAGGGGGGSDPAEFCPNSRMGKSGGGRGACPTTPFGNGVNGTGSGGGSEGSPGSPGGTGGSGAIMIRYKA
tara:strand:- start:1244 stop:2311 length:1068 start_codon:yes stop_codon:yes gene_type:complete